MRGTDNNGQYSKIEKNTIFKGSIHSKTDIRIDGTVEGEVVTTGKVIFGKDANIYSRCDLTSFFCCSQLKKIKRPCVMQTGIMAIDTIIFACKARYDIFYISV